MNNTNIPQVENLRLHKEISELRKIKIELEEELNFHKSIFRSHRGSVIFNLYKKKKDGKDIWIDKIRCNQGDLLELDRDEDIEEWLKPIKCER